MLRSGCLILTLGLASLPLMATAGKLDKPIPLTVNTRDHGRLSGHMTAFDAEGFDLALDDEQTRRVPWEQLPAPRVYRMHEVLLRGEDDAGPRWLEIAAMMREMDGGRSVSEAALNRATRLDPGLEEKAERIRQGLPPDQLEPEPDQPSDDSAEPDDGHGHEHAGGPRVVGTTQADLWGELPEALMASSIEELKTFAEETEKTMDVRLSLHETDNFLFYSDLNQEEAVFWARQLEAMYDRLCGMFDLDKEKNIFRGKCLIFVFQKDADYRRFQLTMHQTDPGNSTGMAHGYGNGYTHVAFYRQPDKWEFAHLLVHEAVHAFLHRYRSPVHVPSWANEGLAETIAAALVPKARINQRRVTYAEKELRLRGNLGNMFDAGQIEGWQYGPARMLTEFMIAQDKKRYANFINGIKDGKSWRESLDSEYGVELDRLVQAFGRDMGLRELTP